MENERVKATTWFWILAVVFFLWNIMGVLSFLGHTFITEDQLAKMTEDQRQLMSEYPTWTYVVFAIAVIFGFMASLGVLLRKKWAKRSAIISLCAIVPQMIQNVFFTRSIEVYGLSQTIIMPILVVVFGVALVWFAGYVVKRGFLG